MAESRDNLSSMIEKRRHLNAFRQLVNREGAIDFSSNDYLGLARSEQLYRQAHQNVEHARYRKNGATGSRLLTGHYPGLDQLETLLASWLDMPAALVYNSGYTANLGFFSSVPQKTDWVLFDEMCHASIRDGVRLGYARAFKFNHNDLNHLRNKLEHLRSQNPDFKGKIYVATESVFSMDGDSPDLVALADFCLKNHIRLVVDEAHALGTYQNGMVYELGLQKKIFATVITFGKALGCHGAAVLGSDELKNFQINYSRSLIYTTALPPHAVETAISAVEFLKSEEGLKSVVRLKNNIAYFTKTSSEMGLSKTFIPSNSAIQGYMHSGNEGVKKIAAELETKGYDVRPILTPTVPSGKERLRFCIHAYNTEEEIEDVLNHLRNLSS